MTDQPDTWSMNAAAAACEPDAIRLVGCSSRRATQLSAMCRTVSASADNSDVPRGLSHGTAGGWSTAARAADNVASRPISSCSSPRVAVSEYWIRAPNIASPLMRACASP